MTDKEFKAALHKASTTPFSSFAQFCLNCSGYRFTTKKGTKLDKWEVFDMGYQDADDLIKGKTSLIPIHKSEINE